MNISNVLSLGSAIIAFSIGSGFATGQEVLQFFTAFGFTGTIGAAVLTMLTYILICSMAMEDGKKLNLATVYSFTLSDTSLIYNAYSMNGGSRTASVTLADAKDSLYNVDVLFDTIVETNIPTVSTEE